jgi:hypothetical protein
MVQPKFSKPARAHAVRLRPGESYSDAWLRWEMTAPRGHVGPVFIR